MTARAVGQRSKVTEVPSIRYSESETAQGAGRRRAWSEGGTRVDPRRHCQLKVLLRRRARRNMQKSRTGRRSCVPSSERRLSLVSSLSRRCTQVRQDEVVVCRYVDVEYLETCITICDNSKLSEGAWEEMGKGSVLIFVWKAVISGR